jgi:hypothetical protein
MGESAHSKTSALKKQMAMTGNWTYAIVFGVVWSLGMAVWVAGRRPSVNLRKTVVGYIVAALVIVLYTRFGWWAFYRPIVFVTGPSASCSLFLVWSARLKSAAKSRAKMQ